MKVITAIPDLGPAVLAQAQDMAAALTDHRMRAHPPRASKQFRRLAPAEFGRLLGVSESRVRQLAIDSDLGERTTGERRTYSLQDLATARAKLIAGARDPLRYSPRRRDGEHLQVIVTMNFKGGSGKTTTSAHLLEYLALRGYRVLGVDLDPQASLSALFGVHSVVDLQQGETVYGAIRLTGERRSLSDVTRETYVPGLSLVPGGLELAEFEHEIPRALMERNTSSAVVFDGLARAIKSVESDYDVVVVDCPPQLGYLTLSGLLAATGVLITIHPQMLDVMSMSQFLAMLGDLVTVLSKAVSGAVPLDWMQYMLTRFEPNDGPQAQMAGFLRALLGDFVMTNATLKSTAISDAGLTNQTIYEVDRNQFTRATYDRAIESVDAVNREIEELILGSWGRTT